MKMYEDEELSDTGLILNNSPEPNRDLLPVFDLPELIHTLKNDINLGKGEPNSMILFKSPAKTMMLILLNNKTRIKSYQANTSISFRVLEGKLNLHIRNGSLTINSGESLTLYDKTNYSLDALVETAFLLTLAS
jgi:hypothetical protein